MIYRIYKILTIIFSPIINLYLYIRILKGKEDRVRICEKFGIPTVKRPEGDILWFQCASVGETNSILPLIDEILKKKDINILITSGTVTSAEIVLKKIKNKNNIIHQYTPTDTYSAINKFLKFWKPKALITVESEIWPNMISMAYNFCERVMIVNGKMSERSFNKWKKFGGLRKEIFNSVDTCYSQTIEDKDRFIELGIKNTTFLGNIKFSVSKLKVNKQYLEDLNNNTKDRQKVLFASMHLEEIDYILSIAKELKNKSILSILAIRHPNKSNEIYSIFTENGFNVKRKSNNENITKDTDIYMCDVMGEMGTMFEFCKICVMCGAFVDGIGGHTPVEPANHSCAIITPPYIFNNKSLFEELEKDNGCIICKDKDNIKNNVLNNIITLIKNENKIKELGNNAKNTCNKFDNVLNEITENILKNIYDNYK